MAEKTLQTRIINKHGAYSDWAASDLVLLEGEIALAKFTVAQEATDDNGNVTVQYVPTYLMKIGDGIKKFSALSWLSAPASDVYAWAKSKSINDVDLSSHSAITGLQAAVDTLSYSDNTPGFVTAVTQTKGKISVTKKEITLADVSGWETDFEEAFSLNEWAQRVVALESRMTDLDNVMKSVTGAMHFVGITTTNPATDGATVTDVASFVEGDVVIYRVEASEATETQAAVPAHDIEYVNIDGGNTPDSWIELGDVTDEARRITALETDLAALEGTVAGIDNHSHDNKELLDSITEDNVHTHENKEVIDGIKAQDIVNWNAIFARDQDITNNDARIVALYQKFGDGTNLADTFIFDCGGVS